MRKMLAPSASLLLPRPFGRALSAASTRLSGRSPALGIDVRAAEGPDLIPAQTFRDRIPTRLVGISGRSKIAPAGATPVGKHAEFRPPWQDGEAFPGGEPEGSISSSLAIGRAAHDL